MVFNTTVSGVKLEPASKATVEVVKSTCAGAGALAEMGASMAIRAVGSCAPQLETKTMAVELTVEKIFVDDRPEESVTVSCTSYSPAMSGKRLGEGEVAFRMGIAAANDRSCAVRHYGCAILAYSLRADALPTLSSLLKHADRRTAEDARAAIDAITNKNHHLFIDRDHSGRVRWEYGSV